MNDTVTIKKSHLRYAVMFVIALLVVLYFHNRIDTVPSPRPAPSPSPAPAPAPTGLNLTQAEATLVLSAINRVLDDVAFYQSIETALEALSSILPENARERVMRELGSPELFAFRDALLVLEGKVLQYE